ncbi:hypothetical protein HKCCSP123_18680 [Rhodobacterales bacterium HKCCSP123]|nr:hypothetical protein [Rhodobacterales bacterium HKCCSP123]
MPRSDAAFVPDLILKDPDAILSRARAEGVEAVPPRETQAHGRPGRIMDPDGRKPEPWQPPG